MNPDPKQKLSALLKDWEPQVDLPSRFDSEVWRRIAASQEKRSAFWSFEWLFSITAQPKFAFAIMVAAVVFGSGLANWQAEKTYHHEMAALKSQYVHSVDPFANTRLASNP